MIVWTSETRLRNVFAKAVHHGHVRNAELSPPAPEQRLLWLTDQRVLREDGRLITELFAFSAVERVHWMARERRFEVSKSDNFDQLEIDLTSGDAAPEFMLDELDQAVFPILNFLQWLTRQKERA
jgi:hypothetical protein